MNCVVVDLARRKTQHIRFHAGDLHRFLSLTCKSKWLRNGCGSSESQKRTSIHALLQYFYVSEWFLLEWVVRWILERYSYQSRARRSLTCHSAPQTYSSSVSTLCHLAVSLAIRLLESQSVNRRRRAGTDRVVDE